MAAGAGRDIDFTWNGTAVAGLREKGVSVSGEPIDVTADEDNGWRTLLTVAAQNEVTISLSGVTKDRVILADWFAGNRTRTAVITYPDGATVTGSFMLASYTDTGPYNDAITFEAEIQSTGTITYAAA